MADVYAFPLSRRAALIRKQAAWFIAQESRKGAEANLRRLLEIQRQALTSKGCDPLAVETQVQQLEGAIRVAAWRYMLVPGGEVG